MPRTPSIQILVRALRLPFTTASALPFIFGSLFAVRGMDYGPNPITFWLGLFAVVMAHLGANLINDYADSRSGADWHDTRSYNFFGGSKLIQEGVLTEKFYLLFATLLSGLSAIALAILAFVLQSMLVIYGALLTIILSWSYSIKPLQLSYHRLGEVAIFILFGIVPVMGGYYIQTGIFPDLASFMVSIPFGLLTAAILYANEIPDFIDDTSAGKKNLANVFAREHAYLGYCALSLLGIATIALNVALGYLNSWSLIALLAIVPIIKAATVLKKFSGDKIRLIESSKLAIATQTLVGLTLIGSVVF